MSGTHAPIDITSVPRHLGALGQRLIRFGAVLAVLGFGASLVFALAGSGGAASFYRSYLANYAFGLSFALGGLFFVMIQHVTHAGWGVVTRRLAEGLAATMPLFAVLFIPVLLGMHHTFSWTHADIVAADHVLQGKAPYLNTTFFVIRWIVFFAIWIGLTRFFMRASVAQDASGDPELTVRMQKVAAVGLFLYAFTVTFAAIDILMSLNPHWFSTIFGVYYFAGAMVAVFSALIIGAVTLQRAGLLRSVITREHYQDLGKLLFAFIVFWAYIAFSQYMLIWYGNMPEETQWFLPRQTQGWGWFAVALIFGHFFLPFGALLSRWPKRKKKLLLIPAIWMVVMHWIDTVWLVLPTFGSVSEMFRPETVTLMIAFVGVLVAGFAWALRERSLVPERDPRLVESLTFENA